MFDRRLLIHFDWVLFVLVLSLVGVGVLGVYSATYEENQQLSSLAMRQMSWAGLGFVGMVMAFAIDYREIERLGYLFYGITLVFLLLVPIVGSFGGGARRWISFGVFSLQPSELAKVALIVALSHHLHYLCPPQGYSLRDLISPGILVAIPGALVLAEPNLGTATILGLVAMTVIFAAGIRTRSLAQLAMAGGGLLPLLWSHMKPYQKQRILSFLNPQDDPLGSGYHMIQSKITIGSGMIWGKGFLQGTQSQLDFLPEKHTDFIFAVLAEEWGFVGMCVLFALYSALLARLLVIAWRARDRFGSLVAVGCAAVIFWQVLINVGMNLGVLPVVGVPLPLLSYGGSSLLTIMIALGLALNVSTRRFLF
ncbi:MAG: rod shape-determining protein RodA [Candidatus Binatia bacterium]